MFQSARTTLMTIAIACLMAFVSTGELPAQDYGLGGRWQGTWSSQSTGHTGPLKARFRPRNDGSVKAIFTGRFAVVVPFRYTMQLQPTTCGDGTVMLSGSKRLGPILGSYDFSARSNGCSLNADYSAGRDQGNFQLRNTSR